MDFDRGSCCSFRWRCLAGDRSGDSASPTEKERVKKANYFSIVFVVVVVVFWRCTKHGREAGEKGEMGVYQIARHDFLNTLDFF